MSAAPNKQNLIVTGLTLFALVMVIAAYFSPIWWVSLTAPNYPKDAFPDGIRIHFHFDGVYNGCSPLAAGSRLKNEIIEKDLGHEDERYNPITDAKKDVNKGAQGLDCVHEMNTINHYVGMHPIGVGAPAERLMSRYIFGVLGVGLLAFAVGARKARVVVLGVGVAGLQAIATAKRLGADSVRCVYRRTEAEGLHPREGGDRTTGEPRRRPRDGGFSGCRTHRTGVVLAAEAAMVAILPSADGAPVVRDVVLNAEGRWSGGDFPTLSEDDGEP